MFDGVSGYVGGTENGSMYSAYNPLYQARAALASPLDLSALYSVIGTTGTATVAVHTEESPPPAGSQLVVLVCRDGYHGQSNMVMEMVTPVPLTVDQPFDVEEIVVDFTVDPTWPQAELNVVAFVQRTDTDEILQATVAVPDYKGTFLIDCEPNGVAAGWQLTGPNGLDVSGAGDDSVSVFFTGAYSLTWADVPFWTTPAVNPQPLVLAEGEVLTFTGVYTDGPFSLPAVGDPADAGPGRGVAMVDFDGDGDSDLHITNEGVADLLLRNDAGVFTNVATGALADPGLGCSSAWHDLDGDGHLDVYVGRNGELDLMLMGDGAGGFTPGNTFGLDETANTRTTSWMDYDLDGLLDLYVVNHDGANRLYKYHGVMSGFLVFGLAQNGADLVGNHSGVAWNDIDGDGRMDMYVLTQFGENKLLQNLPQGFSDVTSLANLGDIGNGTGADWGDFDNDGDFDLYLANDGGADKLWRTDAWDGYIQMVGDHLDDMGSGRGVVWADLDNDTRLDLYVVRGNEPDLLLFGHGDGTFTRAPVGPDETLTAGNAVACGDVDGDGRVDVYITRDGASNVLLHNNLDNGRHWLAIDLEGPVDNPQAIGARVSLTADGVSQIRQVTGGGGWLAMNGGPVHFGLDQSNLVDEVTVTWPDGTVQTFGPVLVDQTVIVVPGQDVSAVAPGATVPRPANRLDPAHPNPFNPATTIAYRVARAGRVRLDVYSVDGRHVRSLVNDVVAEGEHTTTWLGRSDAGRPVASGAYFYRLTTPDGAVLTGRMMLVK